MDSPAQESWSDEAEHRKVQPSSPRQCILVLGMHRSGTSAVTRVLSLLGAALPKNLMGAGPGNETGHWEPARLAMYNDSLLAELGSSWDDWRPLDLATLAPRRRAEVKAEIRAHLDADYGDQPLIVVKEPRTCRFAQLFLEVLDEGGWDTRVVLAFRNPIEVAASLEKRTDLWSPEHTRTIAHLMWLRHVLDAERASRQRLRAVISYDGLLHDWQSVVGRLVTRLNVATPYSADDIAPQVNRFLAKEQRHHRVPSEEVRLDPALGTWIADTLEALQVLESNHTSAAALATLDRIGREFDHASPVLAQALAEMRERSAKRVEGVVAEAALLKQELAAREAERDALAAQSAEASVALSAALSEKETVQAERAAAVAEVEQVRQELAARDAEKEVLVAQSAEANAALSAALSERETVKAELRANAEAALARVVKREAELKAEIRRLRDETLTLSDNTRRQLADIHALYKNSTSWKITTPFRFAKSSPTHVTDFMKSAARAIRVSGGIKASIRNTARILHNEGMSGIKRRIRFLSSPDASVIPGHEPPLRINSPNYDCECANIGTWGIRHLHKDELSPLFLRRQSNEHSTDQNYDNQTNHIIKTYGLIEPQPAFDLSRLLLTEDYINAIRSTQSAANTAMAHSSTPSASRRPPSFTIVTPYYRHLDHFRACALSVSFAIRPCDDAEWIIINDDPSTSVDRLWDCIPDELKSRCRLISDGNNKGISARLNEAASSAHNDWLAFLDCDDELDPDAFEIAYHYLDQFPHCRYLSTAMTDINENGTFLRNRRRETDPSLSFNIGMTAGHLVIINKSFFNELGGFNDRFSGCQDFDLLLRAMEVEPILRVPDHAYRYRWHNASQSVGSLAQQTVIADRVRRSALLRFTGKTYGEDPKYPSLRPCKSTKSLQGLCLVRTQGKRGDTLVDTLASIAMQSPPITPCVIVHGDEQALHATTSIVKQKSPLETVILHAPAMEKRRGYPLNIGIAYAIDNLQTYNYICFCDDDDIIYPTFSNSVAEAFSKNACHIVFGGSNKRETDGMLQHAYSPLPLPTLLASNFITTNSIAISTPFLAHTRATFPEDMHYLEDYLFLLDLLSHHPIATPIHDPVSEFALGSDGNTVERKNPTEFSRCLNIVRNKAISTAKQLSTPYFYNQLLTFDFSARCPLSTAEENFILAAEEMVRRDQANE